MSFKVENLLLNYLFEITLQTIMIFYFLLWASHGLKTKAAHGR